MNTSLLYMDTDRLISLIKTDDFADDAKNGLIHRFMMKEKGKELPVGNKISLMKDESGSKMIIKFATTAPNTYGCRVQKGDNNEVVDSEFTKAKWARKSASKRLIFHDFDKYGGGITNKPLTKEQMSFKSYNHKTYTATSDKIAKCNPNKNDDKEI